MKGASLYEKERALLYTKLVKLHKCTYTASLQTKEATLHQIKKGLFPAFNNHFTFDKT